MDCDGVLYELLWRVSLRPFSHWQNCGTNPTFSTIKAPVFSTLNSAISHFQTWFVRTVMEVLQYCCNMQCNYNSYIQIINFHGLFRNALRCRKTGACRILVPLRYHLLDPEYFRFCTQNFESGLSPQLVPPIRPDYFRFRTQHFESGLTPHLVRTIRPHSGAGLTLQLWYQTPADSEIAVP